MITTRHRFKRIREIETQINNHLFIICAVVTVAVMAMMLTEFFTRGGFPSTQIALFYLGVLVLYSLHKEIVRWLGQRKIDRQGELFVYVWIGLTTALYLVNFLTKNYFSISPEGVSVDTIKKISILTMEVLAIFIFTRILKILKISLAKDQFLRKIKEND